MELFTNTLTKDSDNLAITSMTGIDSAKVSPPPVYGGSSEAVNPEEMFVAAINSCLMLVFYHFINKSNIKIISYNSTASGTVEKTKTGLRFTKVSVEAKITLQDKNDSDKIQTISQQAEKFCLISGSVACPVEYSVIISD